MREATCPACGYHVAVPLFDGGAQPLATLAWPASAEAARAMPRLPLDFVRCVDCGHVYNAAFDYAAVPYTEKPNLMFNSPPLWSVHLQTVLLEIASRLPQSPTVVEIGYGDGSFLAGLAELRPDGRYVGFDPHGTEEPDWIHVEFRRALFEPTRDFADLRPDLIISRHVLEHLSNPLGFVQQLSFGASCVGATPAMYIEVPCIDRALETRRTVDFFYEHNSNFTTESFTRMLARCATAIDSVQHGYDGEVVYGFARLGGQQQQVTHAEVAVEFAASARAAEATIRAQLEGLLLGGRRVAVWGGTGKAAAFMNRYGMDARQFPTVVDSDPLKVGTFVPGTGQEIRSRDWLLEHPVEVVIIPPQWRAREIVAEMTRAGIQARFVLIEHEGRLVDYHRDDHPYRLRAVA